MTAAVRSAAVAAVLGPAVVLGAVAFAGCGSPRGVVLDLTVAPHCNDARDLIDRLDFNVTTQPPSHLGDGTNSFERRGRDLFASPGASNRMLLLLPTATTQVDVSLTAIDPLGHVLGKGHVVQPTPSPRVYTSTLDLDGASCATGVGLDLTIPVGPDLAVADMTARDLRPPDDLNTAGRVAFLEAQYRPSSTYTGFIFQRPAAARVGDVMLVAIGISGTLGDITPPASFTQLATFLDAGAGFTSVWYAHTIGAEAGPYTFSFAGGGMYNATAAMVAYGNCSIDVHTATSYPHTQSTYGTPVVVTTSGYDIVAALFIKNGPPTNPWVIPQATTARTQLDDGIVVFDQLQPTAGSSATFMTTADPAMQETDVEVVALKPR